MPNHRTSDKMLTPPAVVALLAVLLLAIAAAAVGLWFTFHPVDSPSFWDGATDTLQSVRMLGACQ